MLTVFTTHNSEAISKANDVLYVVHCDESEIKSSTPRVEADIRGKLDELFRKHTYASRKLDGIVSKLNKLRVTDLQFRSMKMNLIFTGLGGESKNEATGIP